MKKKTLLLQNTHTGKYFCEHKGHQMIRHPLLSTLISILPFFILMNELNSFYCAVPMWAVGAIVVVVLALVACCIFCVFKKCFGKKKKPKKVRERKTGRRRKEKEGEGEAGDKVSDVQYNLTWSRSS